MRTFKIIYLDREQNELWQSITDQHDIDDAVKYANLILANSMNNDVFNFEIYEL